MSTKRSSILRHPSDTNILAHFQSETIQKLIENSRFFTKNNAAESTRYVVVLHALPVLDGFFQIKIWKKSEPNVAIIVVTDDSSAETRNLLLEKGASEVIGLNPDFQEEINPKIGHRAEKDALHSDLEMPGETADPNPLTPSSNPSKVLKIKMLGNFSISLDGRELTLANQGKVLISLLASHLGKPVSSEMIQAALWPTKYSSSPDCTRCGLNVEMAKIRKTLREASGQPDRDFIIFKANAYQFEKDLRIETDLDDFRKLLETLKTTLKNGQFEAEKWVERIFNAYPASFLVDSSSKNCEWVFNKRVEISLVFEQMLELVCSELMKNRDFAHALSVAQEGLEREPAMEGMHRVVIRCYVERGQCPKARRQYETCASILKIQFNAKPSPETQAMVARC